MPFNVPFPNAFTINRLGLDGGFFPLGAACRETPDGLHAMKLHAQRVVDCCDLLTGAQRIAVFGVEHTSVFDAHGEVAPLQALADQFGVGYDSIDEDTLIMSPRALPSLLNGFSHYNLCAFDIPADYTEEEVIEGVIHYEGANWNVEPVLAKLPYSRFFLDSHDDCYLHLESRTEVLLKQIFARTLQIYVGTVLQHEDDEVSVSDIPSELLDSLWPDNAAVTILRESTAIQGDHLRIGVAQSEFHFGEDTVYPTDLIIDYDSQAGTWQLVASRD